MIRDGDLSPGDNMAKPLVMQSGLSQKELKEFRSLLAKRKSRPSLIVTGCCPSCGRPVSTKLGSNRVNRNRLCSSCR